jgi:hypothetical protein
MVELPSSVLFYPNIELHDITLVKESLLLYDNFYRIVPNGITPEDDPEIKRFVDEYDLIKPIDPNPYSEKTMEHFETKLEEWTADGLHFEDDEKSSFLHSGKVYDKLRKYLLKEKMLIEDGEWLRGSDSLISNYMIFLSNEISYQNKLALLTNYSPAFTAQEYMNYNGNLDEANGPGIDSLQNQNNNKGLLNMCLVDYIPDNIEEISFSDLVEFREVYRHERKNFLKQISAFPQELSKIRDPSVFNDRLVSLQDSLEDSLRNYKNSCSQIKSKYYWGTKVVTIPAFLPVVELFLSSEPVIIKSLAAVGIFFGAFWTLSSYENDLECLQKTNPYSYLDLLESFENSSSNYVNSLLKEEMKEFVCD